MKHKAREWLRRYLPAEALSVVATVMAAALTLHATQNRVSAALAGTWAGNVAYFGYILGRDIYASRNQTVINNQPYTATDFLRNLRALAVEFGVAELADSFFIRPALMYYLPLWLGSFSGGILLAKLLADVTFYVPAIIGYELSKRHWPEKR